MKHRRYEAPEVIEMTRDAIHAFTKRDMERFCAYLDNDFTFIADDEPLYLQGVDDFIESTRVESQSPPVIIGEEEYTLLAHEKRLWVTFGRFSVSMPPMTANIHFTFVWRQREEKLLLLHANAAHARSAAVYCAETESAVAQTHMFDPPHVRAALRSASDAPQVKRPYRDINGSIRYLTDNELQYVRINDKLCQFFVAGQAPFCVRTGLRALERPGFMVIHRSCLVNLSYVREICRYKATLLDGTELPVGKQYYLELKRTLSAAAETAERVPDADR